MWEDDEDSILPPVPGSLSGVNEGGFGGGVAPSGLMFKVTWCRYIFIPGSEKIKECGCANK
jgi:hypothetical protein